MHTHDIIKRLRAIELDENQEATLILQQIQELRGELEAASRQRHDAIVAQWQRDWESNEQARRNADSY